VSILPSKAPFEGRVLERQENWGVGGYRAEGHSKLLRMEPSHIWTIVSGVFQCGARPCDPAIALLGIHRKEIMGQESKDVCTRMFIGRLFILVKTGARLNELWCIHTEQLLKPTVLLFLSIDMEPDS
jgi:hypothetical protein